MIDFINEIKYLFNLKNVEVIFCFEKLLKYTKKEINNISIERVTDIRSFAIFEIAVALVDYGESVLLLAKRNKALNINVLGRSIIEAWFTIKWILRDDSKINALKFYIKNFEVRKNKAKHINKISTEDINKIERNEKIFIVNAIDEFNIRANYEEDFDKLKKYPKYREIAESAGLLEYYNIVYKDLSDYIHVGSVVTGKYFEGGYKIKKNITEDYKNLVILISAIYFYVLDNLEKRFNIDEIEKIEKVNRYFISFSTQY